MPSTFVEDALSRHQRLIEALAEYQASGESSDQVLGAFGLAIVYDFSLDHGVITVTATIHHTEGAWLRSKVPCPGLTIEHLAQARKLARSTIMGGDCNE